MQVARKIPFENEEVLFGLRGAYILSQIIQFAIYYFINMQVCLRALCTASGLPLTGLYYRSRRRTIRLVSLRVEMLE